MKSRRAFVGRWEVDSLSKGLLRARWKDQVSSWVTRQWPGAGGKEEAWSKR